MIGSRKRRWYRGWGSGPDSWTTSSSAGGFCRPRIARTRGRSRVHAELGYRLLRRFWRQGLASEGARELVRHGFEDLRLERIFAETMVVNAASRATMASVGLAYVRTFHLDWDDPIPGTEHGEVEYAITRESWLGLPD